MMWEQVRSHWQPLRDQMRHRWDRLSDQDIDVIAGSRAKLIKLLQERYGFDLAEAMDQADGFVRSLQVLAL